MDVAKDWLKNRARLSPDHIAVILSKPGQEWSYHDLNQRAESLADCFVKQGVQKGERIALLSPNDICYLDLLFACGKIGAIFVPINWRLSKAEINYIVRDSQPKWIGLHTSYQSFIDTSWNHFFINDLQAVIGVPDEKWGEKVCAFLSFLDDTSSMMPHYGNIACNH